MIYVKNLRLMSIESPFNKFIIHIRLVIIADRK